MRVNVASDHWEVAGEIADRHDGVTFYDYTAITSAVRSTDNVRRVYSRKDGRTDLTLKMLNAGTASRLSTETLTIYGSRVRRSTVRSL